MSRDGYSDEIINVVKQFLEEDDCYYDRPEGVRPNLFATKGDEA